MAFRPTECQVFPRALSRRALLSTGMAACLVPSLSNATTAARPPIHLSIFRKGERIGTHSVTFENRGTDMVSRVEVEIIVKVAFITAFKFRQKTEDHWSDGLMVASRIRTHDDGLETEVNAAAAAGKLIVEGPSGSLEAPLGIMTDSCFWNQDIMRLPQLIDAGKGEIAGIRSKLVGDEVIEISGNPLPTIHYHVASSEGRNGDIWYDRDGNWVRSVINTRGERLTYDLAS